MHGDRVMKRLWASAGVLLFVAATVWLPAAHRVALASEPGMDHCPCSGTGHHRSERQPAEAPYDGGDAHASDICPICKLAQTPLEAAPCLAALAAPAVAPIRAQPSSRPPVLGDALRLPFARGPPVRSGS